MYNGDDAVDWRRVAVYFVYDYDYEHDDSSLWLRRHALLESSDYRSHARLQSQT